MKGEKGMDRQPMILIGAGGHAAVVAAIAEATGRFQLVGYTAPATGNSNVAARYRYLGNDEVLPHYVECGIKLAALGVGGIGDNRLRCRLFEMLRGLGFEFPPLVHPSSVVAPDTVYGEGCVIGPGAVINPGAIIGANVIINSGAIVEHECIIGDHVHVAPGAVLCGGVQVGRLAHVGAGAVVIQGVSIGEGSLIGAGAVVVKDIAPWVKVTGNPGRVAAKLKEDSGN